MRPVRAGIVLLSWALALTPPAFAVAPDGRRDPVPASGQPFREGDGRARATFAATPEWRALAARSLGETRIVLDVRTGRPGFVKLAVPLLPGVGNTLGESDPVLATAWQADQEGTARLQAASFLKSQAAILGIEARDLDLDSPYLAVLFEGRLVSFEARYRPGGILVEDGLAYLRVAAGNVVEVGGRNLLVPDSAWPALAVAPADARRTVLAMLRSGQPSFEDEASPRWLPHGDGLVPAWRIALRLNEGHELYTAHVDARSGEVLRLVDASQNACPPPPVQEQLTAGVRPVHVWDEEVVRGAPSATARPGATTRVTNFAGLYDWPGGAGTATLEGPHAITACDNCSNPMLNSATLDAAGNAAFGTGGVDRTGNGVSLVAERTAFYHVNRVHAFAGKWLAPANLPEGLTLRVNSTLTACNGVFTGTTIYLFAAAPGCANTGELPGVIQHEWGHGLDGTNGMAMGDWGEGCADVLDWMTNRESATARGFNTPGQAGLREMDEALAPLRAWPAPECGGGVHCLGEVVGQALWHLTRLLRADPLFGEEAGWHVSEALFMGAIAQAADIDPAGPASVYEAYANAADALFGDGNLANGIPLGNHINAAFSHHAMAPAMPYGNQAYPCAMAPQAPVPTILYEPRNTVTGRPRITLSWAGTVAHEVLRSEDGPGHGKLELAVVPAGSTTYADDGIWIGGTYHYALQPQLATRCIARMDTITAVTAHPGLGLDSVAVDQAGNGAWAPGETVDLRPVVRNLWGSVFPPLRDATGVVAILQPGDPRATILQATANVGTITGNATGSSGAWSVRLANDPALCGQDLTFPVQLESNEGCWPATFTVTIGAGGASFTVTGTTIDDGTPPRNDTGTLEPGETAGLLPSLVSPGGASGVTAVLSSASPFVTVTDANATYGALPAGVPGAPTADAFEVRIAPGVPCGTRLPFALLVTDAASCAPQSLSFEVQVATTFVPTWATSFETSDDGFSTSGAATAGGWQRTDPLGVLSGGGLAVQPDDDATPAPGRFAMVTESLSALPGVDDVDGGCVLLESPVIATGGTTGLVLEYARWFGWAPEPAGGSVPDTFRVSASDDGGGSWQDLELLTAADPTWALRRVDLDAVFGAPPPTLNLRFEACDVDADSLVEAGVDDVRVLAPSCAPATRDADLRDLTWVFDDTAGGDGDFILEAGETIAVTVTLDNVGLGSALSVAGTLSLSPAVPGASVTSPGSTWPDLARGASAPSNAAFLLALDPAFVCGTELPLLLDVTWTGEPSASAGAAAYPHAAATSPRRNDTVDTLIASDDFDGPATLAWVSHASATEDDWQVGPVAGLAGDPPTAASGANVLGTDLGVPDASLAWDGAAAPSARRVAETLPLDLSAFGEVRLAFSRWLTVEDGAREHARILVNGSVAWENPAGSDLADTTWTPVEVDLTPFAAATESVVIAFELETDGPRALGGWNLDDVQVLGRALVPECTCMAAPVTPIGADLRVSRVAGEAVLDWSRYAGDALSFRVHGSADPAELVPPIVLVPVADGLAGPSYATTGAPTPLACWVIRSLDACGEDR